MDEGKGVPSIFRRRRRRRKMMGTFGTGDGGDGGQKDNRKSRKRKLGNLEEKKESIANCALRVRNSEIAKFFLDLPLGKVI